MKSNLILVLIVAFIFTNCQQPSSNDEKGTIKVTIMYPNGDGKTFDMDYYTNNHMPMVARLMGDAMTHYSIDKGISGRTPDDPLPYLAIGYLYFNKLEDYRNAFGPNAKEIVGDIPNYTNSQPTVQISEIMK